MNFKKTAFFSILGILLMAGLARAADTDPSPLEAGNSFTVKMDKEKNCRQDRQYSLLIEGIDTGLHQIGCDPSSGRLAFELRRDPSSPVTPSSKAAWEAMLGSPWNSGTGFIRSLRFTVTSPAASGVEAVSSGLLTLRLLNPAKAVFGAILVIAVWCILYLLGKNSGMVRDRGGPGTTLKDRTFSLARVQMAWWFAIILASYIFLWVVTGEMASLSIQALSLMGISGASGLVSAGLDKSKQAALPKSRGRFFEDLLTDAEGITLHRFQMLVMTVVIGIFFADHVATQLTMPEFDANTLALLGISAGTYLGFKVPERYVDDSGNDGAGDAKSGYSPLPDPAAK